jgi:hypothetical protein
VEKKLVAGLEKFAFATAHFTRHGSKRGLIITRLASGISKAVLAKVGEHIDAFPKIKTLEAWVRQQSIADIIPLCLRGAIPDWLERRSVPIFHECGALHALRTGG